MMNKYLDTPFGQFEMPHNIAAVLDGMSNIELLEKYLAECNKTGFIDPCMFQEMKDRGLVLRGEYNSDIEQKLKTLKQALPVPTQAPLEP